MTRRTWIASHPVFAYLLIWCASVSRVVGFTIISEFFQLSEINHFLTQNNTVTVQCDKGDQLKSFTYKSVDTNGTVTDIVFTCGFVDHIYSKNLVGYVPKASRVLAMQDCAVSNIVPYNRTTFIPAPFSSNPTRNQLTGGLDSSDRLTRFSCRFLDTTGTGTAISELGSNFGGNNACGLLSHTTFMQYRETVFNYFDRQDRFYQSIKDFLGKVVVTGQGIDATLEEVALWQNITSNAIDSITDAQSLIQQQTLVLADAIALGTEALADRVSFTEQQVINLAGAFQSYATGFSTAFNQSVAQFSNAFADLGGQVQNQTVGLALQQRAFTESMNSVVTALQQLQSFLVQIISNKNTRIGITQLAHQAIDLFDNSFPPLTAFITDRGTPPAPNPFALPPNLAKFTIDVPIISYVQNISGVPAATITNLQLFCSGVYLAYTPTFVGSWATLLDVLGPSNCSTATQGVSMCSCYIQISEQACFMPIVAGPGGIDIEPVAKAAWDQRKLPALIAPICQSVPFIPVPLIGDNVIRDGNSFASFYTGLCRRGTWYSDTSYNINSAFFRSGDLKAPFDSNCAFDPVALSKLKDQPVSLFDTIVMILSNSYQYAISGYDDDLTQITGQVPNNMTYYSDPFIRDYTGNSGSCITAYIAGFDLSEFVPIYRIDPTETITHFSVTINGEVTDFNVTAKFTNVDSFLLPGSGTNILGDPANWNALLYNVPPNQVVTSQDPIMREGTVTYGIKGSTTVPNPSDYTIENWVKDNGSPFDHTAAGNSASIWATGIVCSLDTLGYPSCQCTGSPAITGAGPWCRFLQSYQPRFGGSTSSLLFTSLLDIVQITVPIPLGELTATKGSACPVPTGTLKTLTSVTLSLYNSLPQSNSLIVKQTGACAKETPVTIPPKTTVPFVAERCALNPTGLHDSLTIYYTPGTGVYYSCNSTFPLDMDPEDPRKFQGSGELNLTETFRRSTTNNVALQLQQIGNVIASLFANNLDIMSLTFYRSGISINTPEIGAVLNASYTQISDVIDALSENIAENANNQYNYTQLILDLRSRVLIALEKARQNQAAARNSTARLLNDLENNAVDLNALYAAQQVVLARYFDVESAIQYLLQFSGNSFTFIGGSGLFSIMLFLKSLAFLPFGFAYSCGKAALGLIESAKDAFSDFFSRSGSFVNWLLPIFILLLGCVFLAGAAYLIYYCAKSKPYKEDQEIELKRLEEEIRIYRYGRSAR